MLSAIQYWRTFISFNHFKLVLSIYFWFLWQYLYLELFWYFTSLLVDHSRKYLIRWPQSNFASPLNKKPRKIYKYFLIYSSKSNYYWKWVLKWTQFWKYWINWKKIKWWVINIINFYNRSKSEKKSIKMPLESSFFLLFKSRLFDNSIRRKIKINKVLNFK